MSNPVPFSRQSGSLLHVPLLLLLVHFPRIDPNFPHCVRAAIHRFAAAEVLAEAGAAMTCQEMIAAMAAKGYWTSPGGKTPAATPNSAMLKETQTKGTQSRFTKTERGKFDLAARE